MIRPSPCYSETFLSLGGSSVSELCDNLAEVFARLSRCNMTIKPSKLVIAPKSTILFGWEFSEQAWRPSKHKVNPLKTAPEPTTVKQMRSFLGSFKQLSASLPGYAKVSHCLEQLVGGRGSAEKNVWTDTLKSAFTQEKQLATHPRGITKPRPHIQTI